MKVLGFCILDEFGNEWNYIYEGKSICNECCYNMNIKGSI